MFDVTGVPGIYQAVMDVEPRKLSMQQQPDSGNGLEMNAARDGCRVFERMSGGRLEELRAMKAAVYSRYGPPEVVQIQEVEKPTLGPTDVLIRVHATTLCPADWRYRKADPALSRLFSGLLRPTKIRILGMEFAGTVEAVGESVTKFRPGDPVFGSTGFFTMGAHAEYVRVSENGMLAVKPTNMQFEEAAAVLYGGVAAVHFLKQTKIKPGQNVLIYGASGSVGVFAVQLAKHFGARVTGVCSTKNLNSLRPSVQTRSSTTPRTTSRRPAVSMTSSSTRLARAAICAA